MKNSRQKLLDYNRNMAQFDIIMLFQQMASLQLALQNLQQENASLKSRLEHIPVNPIVNHLQAEALVARTATYEHPSEINLGIFKALSQFDGTQNPMERKCHQTNEQH